MRELSQRFGIPRRTLERRASREAWRQNVDKLGGIVTAAALAASEHGQTLGVTAAAFTQRQIRLSWQLLDRIEDLGRRESIPGGELRQLAAAARDAIAIGRNGLGLDMAAEIQADVAIRVDGAAGWEADEQVVEVWGERTSIRGRRAYR